MPLRADRNFQAQKQAQVEADAAALEQREREMHQLEVLLLLNFFFFCFCDELCDSVQHDIVDINDMFRDLGAIVHEQGDMIGMYL